MLGLGVVVLWGLNFLAIHAGLDHFPALFFAALRFTVIAIPVLIFVPRPRVPLRWLLLYGVGFGILQFAFLFTAMRTGMPTGLASLVLQTSAPFTVLLGALLLRERLGPRQLIGLAIASAGIAVIGADRMGEAALLPMLLTLAGGFGWALGNIGSRLASTAAPETQPPVNPLHLTLWMTVIPPIPLFALSAVTEGPSTGLHAMTDLGAATAPAAMIGLVYLVSFGTIAGSGLWTYLMSRYPASTVAPLSLLVPVVGIAAAWLVLHETPTAAQLFGAAVVIAGAFVTGSTARRPSRQGAENGESSEGIEETARVAVVAGSVADSARRPDDSPVIDADGRGPRWGRVG